MLQSSRAHWDWYLRHVHSCSGAFSSVLVWSTECHVGGFVHVDCQASLGQDSHETGTHLCEGPLHMQA